jgi:hypothetical protein
MAKGCGQEFNLLCSRLEFVIGYRLAYCLQNGLQPHKMEIWEVACSIHGKETDRKTDRKTDGHTQTDRKKERKQSRHRKKKKKKEDEKKKGRKH